MKPISPQDVTHLAQLSSLNLKPDRIRQLVPQITSVLKYVEQIQSLELEGLSQTNQVTQKTNEFRRDEVKPGLSQAQAISGAPNTHQGYFVVPALIDHEPTA